MGAPLKLDAEPKSFSIAFLVTLVPFFFSCIIILILSHLFNYPQFNPIRPVFWITQEKYLPTQNGILNWCLILIFVYVLQGLISFLLCKSISKHFKSKNTTGLIISLLDKLEIIDYVPLIFSSDKDISFDIRQDKYIYSGTFERFYRNLLGKNFLQLKEVYKIDEITASDSIENLLISKKLNGQSYLQKMLFELDKIDNIHYQINKAYKPFTPDLHVKEQIALKLNKKHK
jgi:hypothetical protein